MKKLLGICCVILLAFPLAGFADESGWWFNPEENGRGVSIERQGDIIFLALYLYDETSGEPTWLNGKCDRTSNNTFFGPLWKFKNGQCLGCLYKQPDPALEIGQVSIVFHGEDGATLTAKLHSDGKTTNIPLQRFEFGPKRPTDVITGTYRFKDGTVIFDDGRIFRTDDGSMNASGTMYLSNTTLTQEITVEGYANSSSSNYQGYYTVRKDCGFFYFEQGSNSYVVWFWISDYTLTTLLCDNRLDFIEWDVWEKVDDDVKKEAVGHYGNEDGVGKMIGSIVR